MAINSANPVNILILKFVLNFVNKKNLLSCLDYNWYIHVGIVLIIN